jgi:hypothetical protein
MIDVIVLMLSFPIISNLVALSPFLMDVVILLLVFVNRFKLRSFFFF